jgi:hypothetical protein
MACNGSVIIYMYNFLSIIKGFCMLKKLTFVLIALILVINSTVVVFANPTGDENANVPASSDTEDVSALDKLVFDAEIKATEQFLVTITRPAVNETTFKKAYVICGVTEKSDIRVALAIKDSETGSYKYFKNTDGDSSWDIGSMGIFTKEVNLSEGINNLKIVAYKKSETDNLKPGENVQISYHSINVLNESIRAKIEKTLRMFTETFLNDNIIEKIMGF